MFADEIMHLVRHGANQSTVDVRQHVYGHIASYDPNLHRVRCIIPSMTDDDGTPLLSPWMPMGTPWQGAQYCYKGGASAQNPNAGEQVMIGLFDRFRGVSAIPCTFYNDVAKPPNISLAADDEPLQPGEIAIQHETGAIFRHHQNGDTEVSTQTGDLNLQATSSSSSGSGLNFNATANTVNIRVSEAAAPNSPTGTGPTLFGLIQMNSSFGTLIKDPGVVSITAGSVIAFINLSGPIQLTSKQVTLTELPTSAAGLETGCLWRNGNTVMIV